VGEKGNPDSCPCAPLERERTSHPPTAPSQPHKGRTYPTPNPSHNNHLPLLRPLFPHTLRLLLMPDRHLGRHASDWASPPSTATRTPCPDSRGRDESHTALNAYMIWATWSEDSMKGARWHTSSRMCSASSYWAWPQRYSASAVSAQQES
jgi:hypothetical protein